MALKYTLKRTAIMDGDEEIATVRGLSLNDITELVSLNADTMEHLFNQFSGREPDSITPDEVTNVGTDMLKQAPNLMAQIIAVATDAYADYDPARDEISPIEVVLTMPAGLQIACLEKVGEMTFTAFGGPKKVLALALKAMQAVSQSPSPSA